MEEKQNITMREGIIYLEVLIKEQRILHQVSIMSLNSLYAKNDKVTTKDEQKDIVRVGQYILRFF